MKSIDVTRGGVYRIRCKANGRYYIGSTESFVLRIALHVNNLNSGNHHNAALLADWVKYGNAGFTFTPLAVVDDKAERKRMESKLILDANGTRIYNVAGNRFALARTSSRSVRKVRKLSPAKSDCNVGDPA